jgi:hypothetical protein
MDDRRTIALGAVDQKAVDQSEDSVERARKSLKLYQEHLERTNDPMFNRKKTERPDPEPTNWQAQIQAQTTAQDIKLHVPTMAEQLRKRPKRRFSWPTNWMRT